MSNHIWRSAVHEPADGSDGRTMWFGHVGRAENVVRRQHLRPWSGRPEKVGLLRRARPWLGLPNCLAHPLGFATYVDFWKRARRAQERPIGANYSQRGEAESAEQAQKARTRVPDGPSGACGIFLIGAAVGDWLEKTSRPPCHVTPPPSSDSSARVARQPARRAAVVLRRAEHRHSAGNRTFGLLPCRAA